MATSTLSIVTSPSHHHHHHLHHHPFQLPKLNMLSTSFSSSLTQSFHPSTSSIDDPNIVTTSSSSSSLSLSSCLSKRRGFLQLSVSVLGSYLVPLDANATRIEYYATVGEPLCDYNFAKSGLAYCDVSIGNGVQPPRGELINVHYTARFADGTVFDSSYKRGRPLTMRIGAGKVLPGLDQGIMGGGGVPPMLAGGKRKLMIPPKLAYGSEPAGCFQGDCNIPGNATLLYDILFVGIYK
ncbi:Peptidyl-prolyl cis-trans isomerase Fpr3/Fpr4-like protein [Dioscorea alata]|uniref:Peptidyl-prolyl cis-trans isomerase Fpr3/Fpr4-like protein n=1 Tax=Dioscorea alata TaxID=55571 RepID=A0ACB7TXI6_DIOAL|nr:Peptidyl-prolyl cis-trans isomerase Fpr3/Fpr4-like protein [Dioscorea alata]